MVALPWLLLAGFVQVMLLGLDAWTRVNTFSVGWLFFSGPLNNRTQPCISNRPLAVAVAVPVPTRALLQAAIACFMVLPESLLDAHLAAAFGLILKFLSKKICV